MTASPRQATAPAGTEPMLPISAGAHPMSAPVDRVGWRWTFETGLITLLLALAFEIAPVISPAGSLWTAGAIMILGGLGEGLLGARNEGSAEGKAALTLCWFSIAAGLVLLAGPAAGPFQLVVLAGGALLLRGIGALVAAIRINPDGRNWILCRGCVDLTLAGIVLITIPLAMAIALPFTTLATLFSSADAGPEAERVLGGFLAVSFAAAGVVFLAIGWARRGESAAAGGVKP